jgi:hypothetical protein
VRGGSLRGERIVAGGSSGVSLPRLLGFAERCCGGLVGRLGHLYKLDKEKWKKVDKEGDNLCVLLVVIILYCGK